MQSGPAHTVEAAVKGVGWERAASEEVQTVVWPLCGPQEARQRRGQVAGRACSLGSLMLASWRARSAMSLKAHADKSAKQVDVPLSASQARAAANIDRLPKQGAPPPYRSSWPAKSGAGTAWLCSRGTPGTQGMGSSCCRLQTTCPHRSRGSAARRSLGHTLQACGSGEAAEGEAMSGVAQSGGAVPKVTLGAALFDQEHVSRTSQHVAHNCFCVPTVVVVMTTLLLLDQAKRVR